MLLPMITWAAACVCTLGQAVNPVPVGHVALVRAYFHMCSVGTLTFTVEAGQTMPKLLFLYRQVCVKEVYLLRRKHITS